MFRYTLDDDVLSSVSRYFSITFVYSELYVCSICCLHFAPVMTTFPLRKRRNTSFGLIERKISPGNNCGSNVEYGPKSRDNSRSLIGNPTLALATMFCILKLRKQTGMPTFWKIRTYLRAAKRDSSSVRPPVQTMLPEANAKAVVRGSRIRTVPATKHCGLNSKKENFVAIYLKLIPVTPKENVETTFCNSNGGMCTFLFDFNVDKSNFCFFGFFDGVGVVRGIVSWICAKLIYTVVCVLYQTPFPVRHATNCARHIKLIHDGDRPYGDVL